ncbi:MAG: hypothetical protein KBF71_05935 [Alphaproteobacteria bacterium]|jgi:hypothetical protein|nr:hypothetical protein [Alphaproteobacteria bacterium]
MTHLNSLAPHTDSNLTIVNEPTPINSIVTFLTQRVTVTPCEKILSYLYGGDFLRLRLVSKVTPAETEMLRLLADGLVKFRVDLSGACIAAMQPSYLTYGWRSLSFVNGLDFPQLLEPLGILFDFITGQNIVVEDLTIDLSKVFPSSLERDDLLADDEFDDVQVAVETPPVQMENSFAPFFPATLASLKVRTANLKSSELLTDLLGNCISIKKFDLSEQNDFVNWIQRMSVEDRHWIFASVEDLDLSYRRTSYFDKTLPNHALSAVLTSCTSLKLLSLEGCRFISNVVSGLNPEQIQAIFGGLHTLYLSKSDITSTAFTSILLSHPPLRALGLSECETLSDFDSATFDFEKLEFLDLTGLSMKAERLNALLASCANLKQLCLAGCYESLEQITSFAPDQLSAIFGQMEDLMLTGTYTSKHALETVLFACKSLTRLSLGACHNLPAVLEPLTDEQIHSVFGQLKYLDLLQIEEKSTLQLQRLLAQISHLEYLCLDSSPWGKSLLEELDEEAITRLLGNVKYLSLGYMDLSPNAYQKIRRALPNVRL